MNSKSSKVVLVADIFGLTDELIELGAAIGDDAIILDPYQGKKNVFSDEKMAYQFFSNEVGLENYASHVFDEILKYDVVTLIGFSIGAAAIWRCSNKLEQCKVKIAYCFYGSQVRNLLHISPNFPIDVILPKYEEHFSIKELHDHLQLIENVTIQRSEYLHGFMNKRSRNFNQTGYNQYISQLR